MGNAELLFWIRARGEASERVLKAFEKFKREYFVPVEYKDQAYVDFPIPIGFGQTVSQPSLVAFMTEKLDVQPGMKVLEIGAGSGWQAAILAELVKPKGEVFTVERIQQLFDIARANTARFKLKNLKFICTDGSKGYAKEAPFDRIMVTAAAPAIPKPLFDQLKQGGKMIIPVGTSFYQDVLLVQKVKGKPVIDVLMPVQFVPLIGEHGYREL